MHGSNGQSDRDATRATVYGDPYQDYGVPIIRGM